MFGVRGSDFSSAVRHRKGANATNMSVATLNHITKFRISNNTYLQPIITQYFIDNKSEIWLLFLIAHSKR